MRRDFLKLCGAVGLGMALPVGLPSLAAQNREADPYEGPFYVVFKLLCYCCSFFFFFERGEVCTL